MKKITCLVAILIIIGAYGSGAYAKNDSNEFLKVDALTSYDMVIIAPNSFSNALQPLIQHKNDHDVSCFLQTTETIYSEHNGRDDAESIKLFIKDAIETYGVQYVLLAGGHKGQFFKWYVPVRIVHLADGARYTEYVSDFYYADVYRNNGSEFEDWNSNGDNVIAEWGKDTFDLIPDVYVGRLPCRNVGEVETIVDKIIGYENTASGQSWFNNFIVAGGDTVPNAGDPFPYEGEVLCEKAVEYMGDFKVTKLYTSDSSLTDQSDFLNEFNQGCGFALYSGRAGPSSLLTFDAYGAPITPLHSKHLDQLTNTDSYPVFIINGCLSGKFDVTILNFIKLILNQPNIQASDVAWDCIGWDMVKQENGGAIASIAPTSQCWVGLGDTDNDQIPDMIEIASGFLSLEFLRVYADENIDILGEVHSKAIENYVHVFPVHSSKVDCKTVQEYGLLGDPSLKIGGYSN